LPDDDAETTVVLCKLMHHRFRDVPTAVITMPLLQSLGILADKYDCVDSVRSASSWVSGFNFPQGDFGLLSVSYLLNDSEVFTRTSRQLLLSCLMFVKKISIQIVDSRNTS
jgi:hypothetical protein